MTIFSVVTYAQSGKGKLIDEIVRVPRTGISLLVLPSKNSDAVGQRGSPHFWRDYYDSKFEIGVVFSNIFNRRREEKRPGTKTRFNNKLLPVKEFSFTTGTPHSTSFNFTVKL